jgi:hypothetical protein
MATETPQSHTTQQQASALSKKAIIRPDVPIWTNIWFHVVIFVVAFLLVVSRRPDALFNPQFFAEDGALFYTAAYQYGLHSLLISYGGYLHTVLRLAALLAQLFPFAWAPLVMNLIGITFQVLPVNLFLSSRFSNIAFPIRLLGSFIYLALPNSYEIDANATNVQWHMALLACLLLLARPATSKFWWVFDAAMLALTSLSTPMGFLLVPLAALMWLKRRNAASARLLAFLTPGTVIEALTFALNSHSRQFAHINPAGQAIVIGGPNGATFGRFFAIVGRQVFVSALLGMKTQSRMMRWHSIHWIELFATLLGLAVLLYVLRYAATELEVFILFAFGVLTLSLINPLAGTPDRAQWDWLCVPACGNRYYFLPMLAFLSSLIWMATHQTSPVALRSFAIILLLLLPIGIRRDWRYPAFQDYHFPQYAEQFERAPTGTKLSIPINADWLMELTKR